MNLLDFMSNFADEESFSTEETRRQLGHKRYQPVWEMVCKLRDVMGKRDAQYTLDGQVEFDNGFFTTERPEEGRRIHP